MSKKQKRVFAGYYRRYDFVEIHVALVVDDVDTGEKIVMFTYEGKHNDGKNHAMSLKSFCEEVEFNGQLVPKFKRLTQRYRDEYYQDELIGAGFNVKRTGTITPMVPKVRTCRRCSSYVAYAKDMCQNYNDDLNRYNQTIKQKRFVGVFGSDELNALKEDLRFLNDHLTTDLKDFSPLFKKRYIEGLSIRKCAEEMGKNRGSIEYEQNKLFCKLAGILQLRDESDGISRLNQSYY